MKKKRVPHASFDEYLKKELEDPAFRAAFEKAGERFETAYAIVEMRHKAKLSQKAMAGKLKISQGSLSRIEQGGQNLTLATLHKIAELFGKRVKIRFE